MFADWEAWSGALPSWILTSLSIRVRSPTSEKIWRTNTPYDSGEVWAVFGDDVGPLLLVDVGRGAIVGLGSEDGVEAGAKVAVAALPQATNNKKAAAPKLTKFRRTIPRS